MASGPAVSSSAVRRSARRLSAVAAGLVLTVCGGLLALAHGPEGAPPAPPALVAPARLLEVQGRFSGKDEAKDLSAMACAAPPGAALRACLLVSDGVRHARLATLAPDAIVLGRTITLAPKDADGVRAKEVDAEGAAFVRLGGQGFYYVTGSHGASRGSGGYQAARFGLFRIAVDSQTGLPAVADFDGSRPSPEVQRTGVLEALIAAVPELAPKACVRAGPCAGLEAGGVNVEGLAAKDGDLYFGLRAPTADGRAFVLRLPAQGLFEPAAAALKPALLKARLGPAFGIRDLVAVEGGFLILAGLDVSERPGLTYPSLIHFWDGAGEATRPLAVLASAHPAAKAEGLLVLADTAGEDYRLLVLFDGVDGGAPAEYRVPRP
ncbi:DUF3616 domain-containing protein [Xanthobacter sp. KR7-225]|uniref:DUF3616 domain-containing protein n=1 Tax=Xanthobacter sp. KR7-225 TaxID=3156613 RepID=UPI0032B44839